jgi:hypothetical protein
MAGAGRNHGPPANKKQAAGGLSVSETHRVSKEDNAGLRLPPSPVEYLTHDRAKVEG